MYGSISSPAPRTRTQHSLRLFLATVLALVVATVRTTTVRAGEPVLAPADGAAILDWNRNTYRVFSERSYPPPVQALLGGLVATAVFDAVNAIEGGFESYAPAEPGPAGASVDAAVATAA